VASSIFYIWIECLSLLDDHSISRAIYLRYFIPRSLVSLRAIGRRAKPPPCSSLSPVFLLPPSRPEFSFLRCLVRYVAPAGDSYASPSYALALVFCSHGSLAYLPPGIAWVGIGWRWVRVGPAIARPESPSPSTNSLLLRGGLYLLFSLISAFASDSCLPCLVTCISCHAYSHYLH
jgi:hypothetical protein